MDPNKVMELARAVLYAAATGIVVHVAGSAIADRHIDLSSSAVAEHFALVTATICFIVMDGLARYCIRRRDEVEPHKAPSLTWFRFMVEMVGLFALCYWAAITLHADSMLSPAALGFIAAYAGSCIIHNFISYTLILKRAGEAQGDEGNSSLFYAGAAIKEYFRAMICADVVREDTGRLISIASADYYAIRHMDTEVDDPDGIRALKATCRRMAAQAKFLNVALLHAVIVTLALVASSPPEAGRTTRSDVTLSEVLLLVGALFVVFIAYLITSLRERDRYQRTGSHELPDAGLLETISQTIGNVALLAATVSVVAFFPLAVVYVLYVSFMVLTIYGILSGNLRSTAFEEMEAGI